MGITNQTMAPFSSSVTGLVAMKYESTSWKKSITCSGVLNLAFDTWALRSADLGSGRLKESWSSSSEGRKTERFADDEAMVLEGCGGNGI